MNSSSNVMDLQTYALNEIALKLMDISRTILRLENVVKNDALKREAFENMVKQHLSIGSTGLTRTPGDTGLDNGNGLATLPSAAVIPECTNELMQTPEERRLVKIEHDASVPNSLQSPLQSSSTISNDPVLPNTNANSPVQLPSTSTYSTSKSPLTAVVLEPTNDLMQTPDDRRLTKIESDASVPNSLQSRLQSSSTISNDPVLPNTNANSPFQLPSTSTYSTSTSPLTAVVLEPTIDLMQTPDDRRLAKIESDASVPNSSQSPLQPPSTIPDGPVHLPNTSANSRVKSQSLRRSVKPLTQSSSPSAEAVENTPPADEDSPYDSDDDDFVTPRFKLRSSQAASQSQIKLKRSHGSLSTQADSSAFDKNTITKRFFISQGNTTPSVTSGKQKPTSSNQGQLPTFKNEKKVKFNVLSFPKHRKDFSSPSELSDHHSGRNLRSASQDAGSGSSQQQQSSEITKQNFICHVPFCNKEYSTKNALRRHLKNHQESVGGFLKCPVQTCGKVFSNHHTFQKHGFSHTGISLYVCNHCKPEKHFPTKKDKEQHLQLGVHTSE